MADGVTGESSAPATSVQAAGGVVWRPGPSGPEVLVVHRPKYDDWSLPKGKRGPEETWVDCARREVEEETGLRCRLGPELPGTSYTDSKGRLKEVRYWVMTPESVAGEFVANAEVDQARWRPVDAAGSLLSYQRDRDVVEAFAAQVSSPSNQRFDGEGIALRPPSGAGRPPP